MEEEEGIVKRELKINGKFGFFERRRRLQALKKVSTLYLKSSMCLQNQQK